MRKLSFIAAMFLLTACTVSGEHRYDEQMDAIEARVKLPTGAATLSEYARHYGVDKNGFIIGVYAPGYRAPRPDEGCEELLADMTSKEVPCPKEEGDRLLAGQRQWVGNTDKLPSIMDGGCGVITVIYDPKANVVKSALCNGGA